MSARNKIGRRLGQTVAKVMLPEVRRMRLMKKRTVRYPKMSLELQEDGLVRISSSNEHVVHVPLDSLLKAVDLLASSHREAKVRR